MVDAVAAQVANEVVGISMTLIKKELSYLWNSRKNVDAMKKKLIELEEVATDIESQKGVYEVKLLQLPSGVSPWLEQVEEIKKKAKNIQTDGIGVGCYNIKNRYNAGKKSSDILERIKSSLEKAPPMDAGKKILAKVDTKDHASTSGTVDDGNQNSFQITNMSAPVASKDENSRERIFEQALKCLEPNNSSIQLIALCGMGGVGKSHMMERLKKRVEDTKMFNWVVMVTVGQNMTDINALQDAVAEQTGGALTEKTSDARLIALKSRFTMMSKSGEKKILVILDDLWKEVNLQDLGLTSPLPNGFKLLITSREVDVCDSIIGDKDPIFHIGPLNDVEAKTLFFDTVGLQKDGDLYLYQIGEKIIKRCGNLPIALKVISSTLKRHKENDSEWEGALSRLQHHDLKDRYKTVHEVFEISYDYLEMEEQKIFLLSGLFPDDSDIPVEELMRYSWGLKLFSEEYTTLANARCHVKDCVNKLVSANLLAEAGRVGYIKMHDLARTFALSNITQVKQASIVTHDDISEKLTKDANKSYQRILLKCTGIIEFPKDFNCPELTFFKLMDGNEQLQFPENIYEDMKKLQVISFEEMQYPLLPRSLHCSTNVTTLCLHRCELIHDISPIGDLVSLEVLSFADSRIQILPSAIGKLKNLKLLDLTGCSSYLSIDNGVFRNLDQLEELYIRVYGSKGIWFRTSARELKVLSSKLSALVVEFFGNEIKPTNMSLTQLKRFKISIGCLLEGDKDVYSFENTLKLVTNSSELLDCKINELFGKTEKLHLQVKDMKHLKDITMKDSFFKIRVLEVVGCADLRYLFTGDMAKSLRKLEQLRVSNCLVLESLIHSDENEDAGVKEVEFKELKFLALNDLPELRSFCDISISVKLPQLVTLRLGGLPKFTSIYPDNAMQPFINKQIVIPKLEKLKISSMKKLKQIWPHEITTCGSEVAHIPVIRVMKVDDCENLVNLFPTNPMRVLRNLEMLQVKTCDSIQVLFNIDLGSFGEIEDVRCNLRSIHVVDSENASAIWRIEGANSSGPLIRCFEAVKKISIHWCRSYNHIFTPHYTANYFDMRAAVEIKTQGAADYVFSRALKAVHPNNQTQRIALCGTGGVGKTYMMTRLKKAVEESRMFTWVVIVAIGKNANTRSIQRDMADYIVVSEYIGAETSMDQSARHLARRFAWMSQGGEEKILVILDDVWEELDLAVIGLGSPLPDGMKLLLTSRDANVCSQMGVEKRSIFTVPFLSKQEAMSLFYESVGLLDHSNDDPQLHEIAQDIVERCHGIPLHIKLVASSLIHERSKEEWLDVLTRLKDGISSNELIYWTFDLSYQQLKTGYQKEIFLLASLFPGDTDIPMEELMMYVWGLKLLPDDVCSLAEARHIIETSVDVLVNANLLTRSDSGRSVKMEPDVRDFALNNDRYVRQASINHDIMPQDASNESVERLFLDCRGMLNYPVDFSYPKLKLLKLRGDKRWLKFPLEFYDRMENLQVVAFERIHKPLLPHSSIYLQTLHLHSCSLVDDDLSFLGSLINLEILSLYDCGIQTLSSTVGKLRKLKLLDVTGCSHHLSIDENVFENLDMLQELYLRTDEWWSDSRAIRFTDANYKELETLSRKLCALEVELYENKLHLKDDSFKKLVKFKISMGCRLGYYSAMDNSENTLKFRTNLSELVESKFNKLFEKTESLYLQVKDMKNLEDVSMHNHSFCNLRELEVFECPDLTFLFTVEVASGLTKLEKLEVSWCPVLRTLIHGKSGGAGRVIIMFPKLTSLNLKNLPCLMSLCHTDNKIELRQLVKLELSGLPHFTSIFPDDSMQPYAFFNKQVEIPNLEELCITDMEKLKQIWPGGSEREEVNNNNDISKLRKIQVRDCDSLENLFPCNPLPLLNHLEELKVRDCCWIKVLFNMDLGGAGAANMYQLTSSLRRIELWKLENLREIWRMKDANNSRLPIRCFQDVEKIIIGDCRMFRDLFTPTNINFVIKAHVTE